MRRVILACVILLAVAAMFFLVVEPAVAQRGGGTGGGGGGGTRGAPAPLIGVGLPLMAGVLAVLAFARGFWRKEKE
jgi:hypothetical protein